MARHPSAGTAIGMNRLKDRRLRLELDCCRGLKVGECVPFYFCHRSVMLYLIHRANHDELEYRGGQDSILHLEADMHATVQWAEDNEKRWAFTLSNAAAGYCESRRRLDDLHEIDWRAARHWAPELKEGKQAEFLVEERFPWKLVERIGALSASVARRAARSLQGGGRVPEIEIMRDWYY